MLVSCDWLSGISKITKEKIIINSNHGQKYKYNSEITKEEISNIIINAPDLELIKPRGYSYCFKLTFKHPYNMLSGAIYLSGGRNTLEYKLDDKTKIKYECYTGNLEYQFNIRNTKKI